MAIYEEGVLGPFEGRVGNVIGYRWRGKFVMRSRPKSKRRGQSTEKQLASRARLRLMQAYLQERVDFIRKGFSLAPELSKMSAFNAAMSYNLKNSISGEYPDYQVDFSKVVFSRGELVLPKDIHMSQEGDRLRVSWSTEIEEDASSNDQAMIMLSGVEDPTGNHSANSRGAGSDAIDIGRLKPGTELFVHIAFISDDRQRVSDSKYLGSIIVE
ncbi:DUF6266 family protein [Albibacterium profundi]|uniref:DUF6266 family protein n=1 Tax=Albibacterium profundi TaxID=3134906 RepID=A0ABV5CGP0_9SPHI